MSRTRQQALKKFNKSDKRFKILRDVAIVFIGLAVIATLVLVIESKYKADKDRKIAQAARLQGDQENLAATERFSRDSVLMIRYFTCLMKYEIPTSNQRVNSCVEAVVKTTGLQDEPRNLLYRAFEPGIRQEAKKNRQE